MDAYEPVTSPFREVVDLISIFVPRWLWPRRVPQLPNDQVIQLPYTNDSIKPAKSLVNWTLRFEDVLDSGKLHYSLVQLINKPGWRVLGGRLVAGDDKRLAIRIPNQFSYNRPAVRYSAQEIDIDLEEHNLASHLPRSKGKPAVFAGPDTSRPITSTGLDGAETAVTQCGDEPLLAFHVTSFENATLVSLKFPRLLSDLIDLESLLTAWKQVMLNQEPDKPRTPPSRPTTGTGHSQHAVRGSQNPLGWLAYLVPRSWRRKLETRSIRISEWGFAELRQSSSSTTPLLKEKTTRSGSYACPGEAEVLAEWLFRGGKVIMPDAQLDFSGTFSALENIDLGPAALVPEREKSYPGARQPGRPTHSQIDILDGTSTSNEQFQVVGKDIRGNVWISGRATAVAWNALEVELSRWS